MKKLLSVMAAFAMLGIVSMASPAMADCGDCTASADKTAAGECSEAKSASACGDKSASACGDKAACGDKCEAGLVKGGAADPTTVSGYGLGQTVPDFTLADTTGTQHSLAGFGEQVKVVIFYNQNCPYVVEAKDRIAAFTEEYKDKGVVVLAIDAGINNSASQIAEYATGVPYPILVNNESTLARSFAATRTPEVFVLDANNVVRYTGMFDSGKETGADGSRLTPTKDAVDALLAGQNVKVEKTKAFGCTIKFNPATAEAAKKN